MSGWKKGLKKLDSVVVGSLASMPILTPVIAVGASVAGGQSINQSVENGMNTMGLSYKNPGQVNMDQVVKYGIFTGLCLGGAWLLRKSQKRV
jgi:hypothetical protein